MKVTLYFIPVLILFFGCDEPELNLVMDASRTGDATTDSASPRDSSDRPDAFAARDSAIRPDAFPLRDARAVDDVDGGRESCRLPDGASLERFDFRTFEDVTSLNSNANWLRTVYRLSESRMARTADGLRLTYDASDGGVTDGTSRSELRETASDGVYPAVGSTQVYRVQFTLNEIPSTLYGPLIFFQRFNRDVDSPDVGLELSSIHQFPSSPAPNSLQIVDESEGTRLRFTETFLRERNELLVAIHNAEDGEYVVILNGERILHRRDVDMRPSTAGTWIQLGVYWHGVVRSHLDQRAEQVASGEHVYQATYHLFEKHSYPGRIALDSLTSYDPNVLGYLCTGS